MDPPMSVRVLASEVHQEELLLHLARLPAPALASHYARRRRGNPGVCARGVRCLWLASHRSALPGPGPGEWPQPPGHPAGRDPTDTLVVVGAHHDTVPGSPGADDNGSGLAGLLELARVLGRGC